MPHLTAERRSKAQKHRRTRWRWVIAAVALLVLAQCLLAYVLFSQSNRNSLLAKQWQKELHSLTEAQAVRRVHELASLVDRPVPLLVLALTSDHSKVVEAAHTELRRLLDGWQLRDDEAASANVAELARRLAEQSHRFSPSGRTAAGSLTTQILLWQFDDRSADLAQVIVNCETVLRSFGRKEDRRIEAAGIEEINGGPGDTVVQTPPATRPRDLITALSEIPPLPPAEFTPPPGVLESPVATSPPPTIANRARTLAPDGLQSGRPPDSETRSSRPNEFHSPSQSMNQLPVDDPTPDDRAGRLERRVTSQSMNQLPVDDPTQEAYPEDLTSVSPIEVMRLLHSEDAEVVRAADRELVRRNLTPIARQIAVRLTDPDPGVRRELARRLPRVSGIDPTEWLLWLARDEDARVREEAIAILGTSRDPRVREAVRQLLATESDPRILQRIRSHR